MHQWGLAVAGIGFGILPQNLPEKLYGGLIEHESQLQPAKATVGTPNCKDVRLTRLDQSGEDPGRGTRE